MEEKEVKKSKNLNVAIIVLLVIISTVLVIVGWKLGERYYSSESGKGSDTPKESTSEKIVVSYENNSGKLNKLTINGKDVIEMLKGKGLDLQPSIDEVSVEEVKDFSTANFAMVSVAISGPDSTNYNLLIFNKDGALLVEPINKVDDKSFDLGRAYYGEFGYSEETEEIYYKTKLVYNESAGGYSVNGTLINKLSKDKFLSLGDTNNIVKHKYKYENNSLVKSEDEVISKLSEDDMYKYYLENNYNN